MPVEGTTGVGAGGISGFGVVGRVGSGGSRQGSPKRNRPPRSSSSDEKGGDIGDKLETGLCKLTEEMLGKIIKQFGVTDLNNVARVNKGFNQVVYTETNDHVFHLNLTKYKKANKN